MTLNASSSGDGLPSRPPPAASATPQPATERFQRIYALFAAALQQDPETRPGFLEEACAGDSSLRLEVEELLVRDAQANQEGFLEGTPPADLPLKVLLGEPETALVGQRIGPYEVRQWIASGGMGRVYRAVRVDAYHQEAALKLIQRGLWTEEAMRRFSTE